MDVLKICSPFKKLPSRLSHDESKDNGALLDRKIGGALDQWSIRAVSPISMRYLRLAGSLTFCKELIDTRDDEIITLRSSYVVCPSDPIAIFVSVTVDMMISANKYV